MANQVTFKTAQICESGHVITAYFENSPDLEEDHCSKCGMKTLLKCPQCKAPIRGVDIYSLDETNYVRPAYCVACGGAYPWTQGALDAARDLARIELAEIDRNELADIIENLVADTPQTVVAASRFRRIMGKVTPTVAEGFKAILINVASEAAKKAMFPGK